MNEKTKIILSIFRDLPDPRVERTKVHSLEVLMFIALGAYVTGGQSFYDMEMFAEMRKEWLEENIGMISVPSHDTFNRIFQAISPEHFGQCLIEMTQRLREKISGDVVAIDGKTHRGSGSNKEACLHMLNAWSTGNGLVLGQLAVEDRSNEITAAPKLLEMLDLKDCIVTADAMNCQKAIAAKVVEKKADYVLAMKGNHPRAHEEIKQFMDKFASIEPAGYETVEKAHGRLESRKYWQSSDIYWFEDRKQWAGLKSFCMVEAVRECQGKSTTARRYYISSLGKDSEKKASSAIRDHWKIENALHWRLDVIFDEDKSRARTRNAAKNLATLRAITMNLVKKSRAKAA